MDIGKFTLSTAEKLKSRKLIDNIFKNGKSVKVFPIRFQFIFHDDEDKPYCQIGFSVPKRNFKKAVDRNKIKRQLREAYRIQKQELLQKLKDKERKMAIMVIYMDKKPPVYEDLEKYMSKCLNRIMI